jgi:pimeloyl-ACP methyl ester carboxylesterase
MLLAHEILGPESAPPIVLIHGITESRHSWRPIIDQLIPSARVLAVDLRGHGESAEGESYDPISYGSDVVETMASVGMNMPLIIGHSLGGVVASAVAALGAAGSVINVDQPLRLASFKDALTQLEPMLRADDATFQGAMAAMFASMDGPLPASERARIGLHAQANQRVVLGTWESVLTSTLEELDASVVQLASAVTVPYLAIHGIDPGPAYATWLHDLVPTATVDVWPDHGHYPHLVDPSRFLSRIREFERDQH